MNWALLLVALFIPQQQAASETSEDQPFRIGVEVNQVFLSVTARSIQGGFAKDLKKEDFEIFEDGVRQKIVNFAQEAVPVKVVLLIDASGSTRYSQGQIRRAALHFAEKLSIEDQVAIITFNDAPRLILNWTNDIEKIKIALESIYAKGPTVMNDALYVTFDDLLKDVPGKKAVIMLTDGVDTRSSVTFQEALDLAVRSEAIVYTVSKLDEYWSQAIALRPALTRQGRFIPKELKDDYILEVKRSLQSLGKMTGGRVLDTKAFNSLTDVYSSVAEELKNQYYLSYVPSNMLRNGKWRNVAVQTFRPGVVVKTRSGYYAPLGDGSE
ncbi:MAG: VWA domain-containing protein [Acidobacteriota bacterium]